MCSVLLTLVSVDRIHRDMIQNQVACDFNETCPQVWSGKKKQTTITIMEGLENNNVFNNGDLVFEPICYLFPLQFSCQALQFSCQALPIFLSSFANFLSSFAIFPVKLCNFPVKLCKFPVKQGIAIFLSALQFSCQFAIFLSSLQFSCQLCNFPVSFAEFL